MSQSSHVLAEDPAVDLAIAQEMVEELETYIVNNDLYRTVIARTPRGDEKLTMTGGDLLTRLYRLQSQRDQLSVEQQQTLDTIQDKADQVIYSLKTRFHDRLQREMKARLDSIKWFLDDCAEDRRRCQTNYPFEIRNRQRIEEILKQIGDNLPESLSNQLQSVDRRLEQGTTGRDFVWDAGLQNAFPAGQYWYLYRLP
jgi:hypothetical protein